MEKKMMEMLNVRVSGRIRDRLEQLAAKNASTVSDTVRDIISGALEKQDLSMALAGLSSQLLRIGESVVAVESQVEARVGKVEAKLDALIRVLSERQLAIRK